MARCFEIGFLTAVFACAAACGSSDDGSVSGSGSNGDGNGNDDIIFGGNGSAGSNGSNGSAGSNGSNGGDLSGQDFAACAGESAATEAAPLSIYIMFDQSCSMSCPPELAGPGQCCIGDPRPDRIDQVRAAVNDFLSSPDSAGINVGIGYFGHFPLGGTSCDPQDYSQAAVPIGLLPDNAPALSNSLNSVQPVGETPTGAAIRGACAYAGGWRNENPGFNVVTLLVTDGVPETPSSPGCNASLPDAEAAATECLQGGVPTYVLGVGANLDNLSRLARAGGTGDAYLVGAGQDVTGAVLDALNQIRDSAAVPCDFAIPPPPSGQQLNPTLVNVTYRDANGDDHLIRGVGNPDGCAGEGGWYYDNPGAPTLVQLCPASCNDVTAALIAGSVLGRNTSIDIRYGCATVEDIR